MGPAPATARRHRHHRRAVSLTALVFAGGDAPRGGAGRPPGGGPRDRRRLRPRARARRCGIARRPRRRRPRLRRPARDRRRRCGRRGVERHPAAKDATDLELALLAARDRGADGHRRDRRPRRPPRPLPRRTCCSSRRRSSPACRSGPASATRQITVIRDRAALAGRPGRCARCCRSAGPALGVVTDGLRFPLDHETLDPGSTRGVSNEFLAPRPPSPSTTACSSPWSPTAGRTPDAPQPCHHPRRPRRDRCRPRGARGLGDRCLGDGRRLERPTITLVTHDSFAVSKSVLRRVHAADRHHGEGAPGRRRGRRAQPGDPHQVEPDRRRVLRRRQHVPQPRPRRRGLREVRAEGTGPGAAGLPARPVAPAHPDRPRRRLHQLRQAVVRRTRSSRCRRRSTTSRSPRTRACSWSRTRRRRRPGSRSSSRPSPSSATTAGGTTGRSCAPTT